METRSAAKVGVMVLAGIGLFLVAWWYFAHMDLNRYAILATFNDTRGLQRQTPVRMNGVSIGEVKEIRLDQTTLHPVVTLSIGRDFRIPADSRIRITSGLLITNPQVEIMPGTPSAPALTAGQMWPTQYVEAEPASALAQLSPEADRSLKTLNATLETMTPKLARTMDRIDGILKRTDRMMVNFVATSEAARGLIADPKIRQAMHSTLNDLAAMSSDARVTAHTLSVEMRGVVKRNSGKFDELANGAVDLLQKFADTVDAARGAVTRLTEQVSDPRLQQSLLETLDLAKTTLARFNQIASDIHQLTGDANVQSDLKSTLTTLKETSEEGQRLVERVNTLVAKLNLPSTRPRLGIGKPSLAIDFLERGNPSHFRSDVSLRVPIGERNAIDLGLYDFAERNRLITQYETRLSRFSALRYGIYASKLGLGFDWQSTPGTRFTMDAFNPNDLQLNARGLFRINDDFSLWLGADSLFKSTTPMIGIRLSR